jgi:hypothetical protein
LETIFIFLKNRVDKLETLCYTIIGSQNGYILKERRYTMKTENKLRGRLGEIGMTLSEFAENMGFSRPTARRKVDGKVEFTASEIKRACYVLNIPVREVATYFFN